VLLLNSNEPQQSLSPEETSRMDMMQRQALFAAKLSTSVQSIRSVGGGGNPAVMVDHNSSAGSSAFPPSSPASAHMQRQASITGALSIMELQQQQHVQGKLSQSTRPSHAASVTVTATTATTTLTQVHPLNSAISYSATTPEHSHSGNKRPLITDGGVGGVGGAHSGQAQAQQQQQQQQQPPSSSASARGRTADDPVGGGLSDAMDIGASLDDEEDSSLGDELAARADRELSSGMLDDAPAEGYGAANATTERIRFATFDTRLRFFKYMLKLAALVSHCNNNHSNSY
jgi:hypothetical protein